MCVGVGAGGRGGGVKGGKERGTDACAHRGWGGSKLEIRLSLEFK